MRKYFLLKIFLLLCLHSSAQKSEWHFSGTFQEASLSDVLEEISSQTQKIISYDKDWADGFSFSGEINESPLGKTLREVLMNTGLAFFEHDGKIHIIQTYLINSDVASLMGLNLTKEEIEGNTIRREVFQKTYFQLSGRVFDSNSLKPIPLSNVVLNSGEYSTKTDEFGGFFFELPPGQYQLSVSQVGYETANTSQFLSKDTALDIQLFEKSLSLDEVVILGNKVSDDFQKVESGVEVLSLKSIKNLPTFLGEVDIIKSIASLPGVTSVGEGASGFNVRGGNVDENLILMDGIPIFNSSHLFGFFSVFNPDIVKDFTLYKGSIPAMYGGRISSVLNVTTSSGRYDKYNYGGSIGLVASKVNFGGPLVKDKTSIQTGVRYAYPTYILKNFPNKQVEESEANFYDLNSKISHRYSDNSNLALSTYFSGDKFRFGQDTTYSWFNSSGSLQWSKTLDSKRTIGYTGVVSKYTNKISSSSVNESFDYQSSIQFLGLKANYLNSFNSSTLVELGLESNVYTLNNGSITPGSDQSFINPLALKKDEGIELSIYASIDKSITDKFDVLVGLRTSYFSNFGSTDILNYENPNLPSLTEVTDTTTTGGLYGGIVGLEPRASLRYLLSEKSSLKLGYGLTRQNIHVVSITSAIAPGDYWKLSDPNIPQTVANQVSLAYSISSRQVGFTVESYYKSIDNLLDFREGAQVFLNPNVETALVSTKGRSYGIEFKIQKEGRLNGWISYTLSRSERKGILQNSDKWFPTNYDKPHNLSIASNFRISKRTSISTNFIYATGRPITLPETTYFYNDQIYVTYSERNSDRIPNYHRLDLSFVIEGNLKKEGFKSEWAFSIYNIYGRRNPYSIFFDSTLNGLLPRGIQLSILGQAFPSISYRFKFE